MNKLLAVIAFILVVIFLFSRPSCSQQDECVYDCTITYTVDGNPITEKIENVFLPVEYTPAYMCGNGVIKLMGSGPGNYQIPYANIITTNQTVAVQDFQYTLIRKCKTSRWNGHEIKPKDNKK